MAIFIRNILLTLKKIIHANHIKQQILNLSHRTIKILYIILLLIWLCILIGVIPPSLFNMLINDWNHPELLTGIFNFIIQIKPIILFFESFKEVLHILFISLIALFSIKNSFLSQYISKKYIFITIFSILIIGAIASLYHFDIISSPLAYEKPVDYNYHTSIILLISILLKEILYITMSSIIVVLSLRRKIFHKFIYILFFIIISLPIFHIIDGHYLQELVNFIDWWFFIILSIFLIIHSFICWWKKVLWFIIHSLIIIVLYCIMFFYPSPLFYTFRSIDSYRMITWFPFQIWDSPLSRDVDLTMLTFFVLINFIFLSIFIQTITFNRKNKLEYWK